MNNVTDVREQAGFVSAWKAFWSMFGSFCHAGERLASATDKAAATLENYSSVAEQASRLYVDEINLTNAARIAELRKQLAAATAESPA